MSAYTEDTRTVPSGWEEYERRVREYEEQGLTRSDAQGVVDCEYQKEGREPG